MMTGLLKRTAAALGLLALAPVGYQLAIAQLTPVDAGIRAAITLLAVVVIRRIATMLEGFLT